ncbi:MAG: M50 family metallopeptidase [Ruminococcaceae bacterium]|nr:M50 family metallopeptidase [Oscillospiraceae bacterium]
MNKKEKGKFQVGQALATLAMLGVGVVVGIVGADILERSGLLDTPDIGTVLIRLGLALLILYAALYIQIIIHEAGHGIAGLLTGYRFVSFRIGSFIWLRQDGKLKLRRLSIAGTGGQCLMAPPDLNCGKMPYKLYNLGGSAFNLITAVPFYILFLLFPDASYASIFCCIMAVAGFAYALLNGIPMRVGPVDNDGRNAVSLGKTPEALRAFWLQLKVNECQAKGERLRDMPDEWFCLPDDEQLANPMTATVAVLACNRLMDEQRLSEADALMERLLSMKTGILGLHRSLLICDRITCAYLCDGNAERATAFLDKPQRQFMKSMAKFPSVIRTQYICAKLGTKDEKAASKYQESFEKTARSYPHPVELELERELMARADAMAAEMPLHA